MSPGAVHTMDRATARAWPRTAAEVSLVPDDGSSRNDLPLPPDAWSAEDHKLPVLACSVMFGLLARLPATATT
jgi:hypothetical protein